LAVAIIDEPTTADLMDLLAFIESQTVFGFTDGRGNGGLSPVFLRTQQSIWVGNSSEKISSPHFGQGVL
jgi:hypothetical protein